MSEISAFRRNAALLALSVGGFGIGVTEFASMGVLPNIAEDLLPDFATHPAAEISRAGILISLYALGVVIGAPVFAVLAARVSQSRVVFWMLGLFVCGSLATALAPTFELLAVARFVSGLPHAAYFGAASLLAGRLLGPGAQGRGIAIVLAGLPIANIVGVPMATGLGQAAGWRWAYGFVASIFLLTLVLTLVFLPRVAGDPTRSMRGSLVALRNVRVWIMVALASLGFGGFFALYSYIAEVTTRVTGFDAAMIPLVLAAFGTGMTAGNFLGGWAADRNGPRILVIGFSTFIAAMLLYLVIAPTPVGLFISVLLVGFTSSLLMPGLQARFIRIGHEAALLGAALSHAALNLGNALGAWLGGLVIAAGFGYLAPGWVGVALGTVGLALLWLSLAISRRDRKALRDTTGITIPRAAD